MTVAAREGAGDAPLRRVLLVAVVAAVLVGAGTADRLVGRGAPGVASSLDAMSALRVAPARGTESSSWYCAGGTGAQGGAPATIEVANASARTVTARVTAVPALASGIATAPPWAGARTTTVRVPPGGAVTVPPADLGATRAMAAAVVLDGGAASVAEGVSSPLGWSMAPCAAAASTRWYFAHGATSEGSGLTLSLFNPGATDATVDVSLLSPTAGFRSPAAYQGIGIPPGTLVTENVGDHAAQDPDIATEVSTLTGTVVATELMSVGVPGDGGISLVPGSPAPGPVWAFAQNADEPGSAVRFHVLNPSGRRAQVSVALGLPKGSAAEPLSLTVPAQSVATVVAEDQTRIPSGVPYSLTFTSRGAAVVVSRQVRAPAGSPAPVPEVGETVGLPGGARRWLLPTVVPPGTGAWTLAVQDMARAPATVHLVTADGRAVPGGARVVAGTPLVLGPNLPAPFGVRPLEVVSDQPVAVELDAEPVAGPGVVVVPAFALG